MDKELTIKEFRERLIKRAKEDESFKKMLSVDPVKAIEEEFGEKLPESVKLIIHKNDSKDAFYQMMTADPEEYAEGELEEEELDRIAGGLSICIRGLFTYACSGFDI